MSKRLMVMLAVVLTVVVGSAVAWAQETDRPGKAERVLAGKGFLNASGSGSAQLEMRGVLRMAADGGVVIVDIAGDARVRIGSAARSGDEAEALASRPTYELTDFQGGIRVVGSHFTVEVAGFTAFQARGGGKAELVGEGVWKTRNNRGFWSEAGVTLGFESEGH